MLNEVEIVRKGYCFLLASFVVLTFISLSNSYAQSHPWENWVEKKPEIYTPWQDYKDALGKYGKHATLGELIAAIKNEINSTNPCRPAEVTLLGDWNNADPYYGVKHIFVKETYKEFSEVHIKVTRGTPDCSPANLVDYEFDLGISHWRGVHCPAGSMLYGDSKKDGICRARESLTCDGPTIGNPCSPINGGKSAVEKDFSANNGLGYTRYYHSRDLQLSTGTGVGWRHNYSRRWVEGSIGSGGYLETNSGYKVPMIWSASLSKYNALGSKGYVIDKQGNEWVLQKGSNARDIYNEDGLLVRIENNNKITHLSYQNGLLVRVEDSFGHFLAFTHNSENLIETVQDQSNIVYRYEYDAVGNLTAVVYPDLTPSDNSDNPKRVYHYENTNFPNHLTGITDANGSRYSTYVYDLHGQAISTEHAETTTDSVGQERFQLNYLN